MIEDDFPTIEQIEAEPLRYAKCPHCIKTFMLRWNDDGIMRDGKWVNYPDTLHIRGCPSGGIYDVFIQCPHCNFRQDL